MSLPLKSIEECFEVDMVNYSQLIQELWREFLQLLTDMYVNSFCRTLSSFL
jgi:hypothetical protein